MVLGLSTNIVPVPTLPRKYASQDHPRGSGQAREQRADILQTKEGDSVPLVGRADLMVIKNQDTPDLAIGDMLLARDTNGDGRITSQDITDSAAALSAIVKKDKSVSGEKLYAMGYRPYAAWEVDDGEPFGSDQFYLATDSNRTVAWQSPGFLTPRVSLKELDQTENGIIAVLKR